MHVLCTLRVHATCGAITANASAADPGPKFALSGTGADSRDRAGVQSVNCKVAVGREHAIPSKICEEHHVCSRYRRRTDNELDGNS